MFQTSNTSGKVGNISAAIVANKTVFLRTLRTALFSALCANAVVVGVYFFVAAETNHISHLCNNFLQMKGFSNVNGKIGKSFSGNIKARQSGLLYFVCAVVFAQLFSTNDFATTFLQGVLQNYFPEVVGNYFAFQRVFHRKHASLNFRPHVGIFKRKVTAVHCAVQ